jgi:hypothetical protein
MPTQVAITAADDDYAGHAGTAAPGVHRHRAGRPGGGSVAQYRLTTAIRAADGADGPRLDQPEQSASRRLRLRGVQRAPRRAERPRLRRHGQSPGGAGAAGRARHRGAGADTWFIGAEHNTCDELITLYDPGDLPAALDRHCGIAAGLDQACERCRPTNAAAAFASAPRDPAPTQALRHVVERSRDFSQARPELGHATNAAALVGRRSMSQGLFLDRRAFLISYDPTQDPSGTVLEGILLAVGPVGAGINLEYYFSTVNNERLGCGTKTPHNVTGLFAVMEGASSDLRTGLPRQMIEIHEPLRLQIVVEASTEVLAAIYQRQPSLRELIGGDWVHVIAKDPNSGEFSIFDPARGFVPWAGPVAAAARTRPLGRLVSRPYRAAVAGVDWGYKPGCSSPIMGLYFDLMKIIAIKVLREFWEQFPDAEQPLKAWVDEVKKAHWNQPAEIKNQYCNASILKNRRVVFNIKATLTVWWYRSLINSARFTSSLLERTSSTMKSKLRPLMGITEDGHSTYSH